MFEMFNSLTSYAPEVTFWPRYLAHWFNLTLSRSSSKVKKTGQRSRSQDEKCFFSALFITMTFNVGNYLSTVNKKNPFLCKFYVH